MIKMKKETCFMMLIFIIVSIPIIVFGIEQQQLEESLVKIGVKNPKVSINEKITIVEYTQPISEIKTEKETIEKYAKIIDTVGTSLPYTTLVKIKCAFDDGQILEISGDPETAQKFLNNQMSEDSFLESLTLVPLTRGPVMIGSICDLTKGENCEDYPIECSCYPNEECDPSNTKANKRGCVGEKPPHSHLVEGEYVCDNGYEWSENLTGCVLEKTCPTKSFRFQGECYCKEGYEWNSDKTECIESKGEFDVKLPKLTNAVMIILILGILALPIIILVIFLIRKGRK